MSDIDGGQDQFPDNGESEPEDRDVGNATISFESSDLELPDETVEGLETGNEMESDDEEIVSSDRTLLEQDYVVDGYKAVSVGDRQPWKTEAVAELFFEIPSESDKLLARVPSRVQRNACFLIDLSGLKSDSDILADSNGTWILLRAAREANYVYEERAKQLFLTVDGDGKNFKRRVYNNSTVPDYKRVIITCKDLHRAFVQYYFKDGQEKSFKVQPHGNSKSAIPHDRLRDSTRKVIQVLADQGKKPREIHKHILNEIGGPSTLDSTAALPSMKAIYNQIASNKPSGLDDFNALILRCIKENGTPACFVRQVCVAPSFMVMLANDRQLDDLVRFAKTSGFSLDTTFNIGDYLVTVVVTRHRLLHRKSTGVHPVIIGALFLHKYKDAGSYRWMAAQLLHARPELRNAKYFGSDGDPAMYGSFQEMFFSSLHVLCMIHFTENMIRKISEHGMGTHRKPIMEAILGRRDGDQRTSGYIDCKSDEEYNRLETEICDMISAMHPTGHLVADYFRVHKAPQLRQHYSYAAQEAAGLNGNYFDTNIVESMNAVIKKDVRRKRSPTEFAQDVEEDILKQGVEFEYAIIGKGEFEVIPQYKHLEINFKSLSSMTVVQKTAVVKRIHTEPYDPNREFPEIVEADDAYSKLIAREHGLKLSEVQSVSAETMLGMLHDAERILLIERPVTDAPGPNRAKYLVAGAKFHAEVIIDDKSMEIMCSKKCHHFVLYGFCPDVLAAAIFTKQVDVIVKWANSDKFKKSKKFGLHQLVKSNAPAKVGQKSHGTSVRRGNTTRSDPISVVIPSQPSSSKRTFEEERFEASGNASTSVMAYSPELHREALWERISVQALGSKPQPNIGEYEIWFLDQCDPKTTKCCGCERPFRKDKIVYPNPPHDAVFVTCGKRRYKKKGEEEFGLSKAGNIYLHLQKSCLLDGFNKMEMTSASASTFVTNIANKCRLTQQHEQRLWAALF